MSHLITFLIIAAIIGIPIYSWYQQQKRQKELFAWAQSKGLDYFPGRNYSMDGRFPELKVLRQGENRYAYNVIQGLYAERDIVAFDYHYETHSRDSKGRRQTHHYHLSLVVLESSVPLKPLFIRPEGFLDKIAEFFGVDDIDFESAEFSRKFFVKADDRKWAYDVIHTRTMEFLLAQPRYTIQFNPLTVAAWRTSLFKVADYEAAAETVRGILERLPEYVIKQLKERG